MAWSTYLLQQSGHTMELSDMDLDLDLDLEIDEGLRRRWQMKSFSK